MSAQVSNCGHDENNRYSGGKAGDQTGTEYRVTTWYLYSGGWDYIFRPKDEKLAKELASVAIAAANNNNIGYDQSYTYDTGTKVGGRLSYYNELKKANWHPENIKTKCETDCSASTAANLIAVGYRLGIKPLQTLNNCMTTYGFYDALKKINLFTIVKVIKEADAKAGDINLKTQHHINITVTNGANIKTTTSTTSTTKKITTTSASAKTTFIKGVQKSCGAKVDGIAGSETLSKTITISATKNNTHAVVKYIQTYLNYLGYNCGTADGIAGSKFTAAIKKFQKANGCVCDGEITAKCKTWKKLLGLV